MGHQNKLLLRDNSAIFLDRDGTLIKHKGNLGNPSQVELIDGVANVLATLTDAGWLLVVVTNQPGVAHGIFTEQDITLVHNKVDALIEEELGRQLPMHYYYCCWHPKGVVPAWTGHHPSRKPEPGMLTTAAIELGINLNTSWMIGDSQADIQAGIAAGCQTIWLKDYDTETTRITPTLFAPSLMEALLFVRAHTEVCSSPKQVRTARAEVTKGWSKGTSR